MTIVLNKQDFQKHNHYDIFRDIYYSPLQLKHLVQNLYTVHYNHIFYQKVLVYANQSLFDFHRYLYRISLHAAHCKLFPLYGIFNLKCAIVYLFKCLFTIVTYLFKIFYFLPLFNYFIISV